METVLFRQHKASFGPYLRALRTVGGLSLRDAGARLGITFAKLQKMESGGRFRIESPALFDALAALFGRPVTEVLAAAGVRFDAPTPEIEGPTLWRFSRAEGWSKIADFTRGLSEKGDCDEDVRAAGFSYRALEFGHEGALHVEVHPRSHGATTTHGYDYFIWVNLGDWCTPIVVPALPDLVALLNELKPLAEPFITGITGAPAGWTAGGKRVAAFGLTPDGGALPLVAGTTSEDSGLVVEFGGLRV